VSKKPTVEFYDSLGAFHAALPVSHYGSGRRFAGGDTYEDARTNLFRGNADAVRRSDEFLEKLEEEGLSLPQAEWQRNIAGAFPCVPSFITGAPDSMYEQVSVPRDTTPIRIFASVCCSAGVEPETLEKRGVTLLALVRKLQAIRPVELWVYCDIYGKGGAAIPVIRIDTSTMDLTSASYALAHAGFLRQLCFAWGEDAGRGFDGGWAWNKDPRDPEAIKKTRAAVGAREEDMLIPGAYLYDPLVQNPLAWLNEKIAFYSKTLEDAEY
jgi:hypothetical protein